MTQTLWPRVVLRIACVAVSIGYVVSAQVQERPDFSGTWELLTPELQAAEKQVARAESLKAKGIAGQQYVDDAVANVKKLRGEEGFVIAHNASTMSVTQGQSKQVFAIYNLDGSDSRYVVNDVPTSAKASWVALGLLVATETATRRGGTPTQGKRSWSINSDGLLTMRWTELSSQGGEVKTTTAVYRRAKTP